MKILGFLTLLVIIGIIILLVVLVKEGQLGNFIKFIMEHASNLK